MPKETLTIIREHRSVPGGSMFTRQTRVRELQPDELLPPNSTILTSPAEIHDWKDDEDQF